jgi:hydrogenase expression/formation protein HypC
MCVALPARVEWIGDRSIVSIPGRVRIGEARLEVDLLLVPEVVVGDHVFVHSGYAISIVPESAADETLALLNTRDQGPKH